MNISRRDFGKLAVSAGASLALPGTSFAAQSSKIDGVQIGAITYSFRQGVDKKQIPTVMQKIGLSEAELNALESALRKTTLLMEQSN